MISRLEGQLTEMDGQRALVQCGHITYEVLVPAADQQRLSSVIGEEVVFQTLHYLEGQGQGASYVPRLIGFASKEDREFFELFTSVKGMGVRKTLRALQLPFARIAEAIAAKDVDLLKSLPEIGKRTAETIVVQLSGKVDEFVEGAGVGGGTASGLAGVDEQQTALMRDAVAVLTMLGEPKLQAMRLVERAIAADSTIQEADTLVAAAYRLKELA
ncbi:MAG: hypothetical protein JSV91_08395 [Phycisphaerales bacterium]|nr:MAG: hypothetical protein JSV91_08395 [Phycisphaerales bacterium]